MIYYAVGDIHGMHAQLVRLIEKIEVDAGDNNYRIIFLGDYVDRGPESKQVINTLIERTKRGDIALMGNHEQMMLMAYDSRNVHSYMHAAWFRNGGKQTAESYGWVWQDEVNEEALQQIIPARHMHWMRNLRLFYQTDTHIFVHAGLRPGKSLDQHLVDDDLREDMLWIYSDFLFSEYDWGKKIVHGHSMFKEVDDRRPNRVGIDTGCHKWGTLTAIKIDEHGNETFIQEHGLSKDDYIIP